MAIETVTTKTMGLRINGREVPFEGDPNMPLLWFLRDDLQLTGTKYGCGVALCGACTVHVDGRPVRSCMLPVGRAAGRSITTVEAVGETQVGKAVQDAWVSLNVVQCGYCQSGQIMAASALLASKPDPSDADIDAAMSANVCRCATYKRIKAAIHEAAKSIA